MRAILPYYFFCLIIFLLGCEKSRTPAPVDLPNDLEVEACLIGVSSDTFEIMTWNAERFPLDGDFSISQIQKIISKQDPDLIAFQEITSKTVFDKLADSLEEWKSQLLISGDLNLGFLYKTSEVSIIENINPILEGNLYALPRAPVKLVAKHRDGIEVNLINIHLKCCGGMENIARRDSASRLIKDYIDENLNAEPVILLGDYNDLIYGHPDNENPFSNFIEDEENYVFTDMEIAMGNRQYWSYPGWPSHIDHILISDELFDLWAGTTTVTYDICDDRYFKYISDHRPLIIKLVN